jgi:hypothetical protein
MSISYNTEDNIDFYNELYKSLDTDDILDDENVCLITNEPLTDNFVQLVCGHKFNYIPIYNDIKNHKQKFNRLESYLNQLKVDEIRCPYCRNKQKGLLPFYDEIGLPKLHGVNYIDLNMKNQTIGSFCTTSTYSQCQYLKENQNYDPSANDACETNSENNGNCKYFKCLNIGFYKTSQIEGYNGPNINVCFSHKKYIIKQHNQSIKNKEKEEKKKLKIEQKIKEKETKLKEKQDSKMKAKEDKIKAKTPNNLNIDSENIIISENININLSNNNNNKCIKILKSGPNKGKACGCKIYELFYCKRHIENVYK